LRVAVGSDGAWPAAVAAEPGLSRDKWPELVFVACLAFYMAFFFSPENDETKNFKNQSQELQISE
jgi:hypothetical protein